MSKAELVMAPSGVFRQIRDGFQVLAAREEDNMVVITVAHPTESTKLSRQEYYTMLSEDPAHSGQVDPNELNDPGGVAHQ